MRDEGAGVQRADVERWVEAYVEAWRTAGTEALARVFTEDATYSPSPWAAPLVGLAAIGEFWEAERDGPGEGFDLTSDVIAVEAPTAVVRVSVDYATSSRWRDLWVLQLEQDGRCCVFEEWPFAPDQADGHSP
jgi:uncharacterized protein (TIGR02246 family)